MTATTHQAVQAVAPAPMVATHSAATAILNAPALPADLANLQLLDIKAVGALVGLKSSAIQDRVRRRAEIEAEGGVPFPSPIHIGTRCTRWTAGSIKAWLQAQIEAQHENVKQRQQVRAKKASDAAQARRQSTIRAKA